MTSCCYLSASPAHLHSAMPIRRPLRAFTAHIPYLTPIAFGDEEHPSHSSVFQTLPIDAILAKLMCLSITGKADLVASFACNFVQGKNQSLDSPNIYAILFIHPCLHVRGLEQYIFIITPATVSLKLKWRLYPSYQKSTFTPNIRMSWSVFLLYFVIPRPLACRLATSLSAAAILIRLHSWLTKADLDTTFLVYCFLLISASSQSSPFPFNHFVFVFKIRLKNT